MENYYYQVEAALVVLKSSLETTINQESMGRMLHERANARQIMQKENPHDSIRKLREMLDLHEELKRESSRKFQIYKTKCEEYGIGGGDPREENVELIWMPVTKTQIEGLFRLVLAIESLQGKLHNKIQVGESFLLYTSSMCGDSLDTLCRRSAEIYVSWLESDLRCQPSVEPT